MSQPKKIPIAAAKRIAEEYGYEQVIIYGRRHSDQSMESMATYGIDKANCEVAARMGETLRRFMGWKTSF